VRGHESLQRAAAREEPGVQEQEQPADTVRRAIAREEPDVQEHESLNMQNNGQQQERSQGCKNMSHYNEPLQERSRVREQEQPADTVRQAIAREEPGV
jgi:hypothetical protein